MRLVRTAGICYHTSLSVLIRDGLHKLILLNMDKEKLIIPSDIVVANQEIFFFFFYRGLCLLFISLCSNFPPFL